MKNVELLFANLQELCLFKRSSDTKDCQMDFDRKLLKGIFPEAEITLATTVFGAIVTEHLLPELQSPGRNQHQSTN
jgi:hypothetical protein